MLPSFKKTKIKTEPQTSGCQSQESWSQLEDILQASQLDVSLELSEQEEGSLCRIRIRACIYTYIYPDQPK